MKDPRELEKVRDEMSRLEIEDMKFLMKHAEGRRFLRRVLTFCGCFRSGSTQNAKIYAHSARRDVSLWVLDRMHGTGVTPEQLGAVLFGNDGEYRELAFMEGIENV